MKIKFGELTVKQLQTFCKSMPDCTKCPLWAGAEGTRKCLAYHAPCDYAVDKKVDLPKERITKDDQD